MKGYKKTCHVNSDNKRPRVAILISGNIYFKAKNVTRDKARNFVIIEVNPSVL